MSTVGAAGYFPGFVDHVLFCVKEGSFEQLASVFAQCCETSRDPDSLPMDPLVMLMAAELYDRCAEAGPRDLTEPVTDRTEGTKTPMAIDKQACLDLVRSWLRVDRNQNQKTEGRRS